MLVLRDGSSVESLDNCVISPSYWQVGVFGWDSNQLIRNSSIAMPRSKYGHAPKEFVRAEAVRLWNTSYEFGALQKHLSRIAAVSRPRPAEEIDGRPKRNVGGRPPSIDWVKVTREAGAHVYRNTSQMKLSDLVKHIEQWLQAHGIEAPDERTIRRYVKPVLDEYKGIDLGDRGQG